MQACNLLAQLALLVEQAPRGVVEHEGGATDVRLRAAARHDDPALIDRLHREVTALWTGGPAGGGGVKTSKRQRLAMRNFFVPRELAPASFHFAGRESRP